MANNIKIKICGQNNPAIINHCLDLNISYQGLIFYEKSPRFIDTETLALVNQYFKTHKENNTTWDWSDFKNVKKLPFILSGGLNVTNIKKAISLTGADFVDINSGVEEQPGEKSLTLIDGIISSIYN